MLPQDALAEQGRICNWKDHKFLSAFKTALTKNGIQVVNTRQSAVSIDSHVEPAEQVNLTGHRPDLCHDASGSKTSVGRQHSVWFRGRKVWWPIVPDTKVVRFLEIKESIVYQSSYYGTLYNLAPYTSYVVM